MKRTEGGRCGKLDRSGASVRRWMVGREGSDRGRATEIKQHNSVIENPKLPMCSRLGFCAETHGQGPEGLGPMSSQGPLAVAPNPTQAVTSFTRSAPYTTNPSLSLASDSSSTLFLSKSPSSDTALLRRSPSASVPPPALSSAQPNPAPPRPLQRQDDGPQKEAAPFKPTLVNFRSVPLLYQPATCRGSVRSVKAPFVGLTRSPLPRALSQPPR